MSYPISKPSSYNRTLASVFGVIALVSLGVAVLTILFLTYVFGLSLHPIAYIGWVLGSWLVYTIMYTQRGFEGVFICSFLGIPLFLTVFFGANPFVDFSVGFLFNLFSSFVVSRIHRGIESRVF